MTSGHAGRLLKWLLTKGSRSWSSLMMVGNGNGFGSSSSNDSSVKWGHCHSNFESIKCPYSAQKTQS